MTLKRPRRRLPRLVTAALTFAVVVAWVLLLRPQLLGGPAAYVIVSGKSMEPALHNGDLVVALKKSSYRDGDVIAYRIPKGDPGEGSLVIHRVIGGSASAGYVTQGDNREGRDLWEPKPRDVLGSTVVRAPRVGLALGFVQTPLGLAISAALATFLFVSGGSRRRGRRGPGQQRYSVPPPISVTRRAAREVSGDSSPRKGGSRPHLDRRPAAPLDVYDLRYKIPSKRPVSRARR